MLKPKPIEPQRRRGGRFPMEIEATVYDESADRVAGRRVLLFNVSMTGMGFRGDREMAVGSVHRVHLDIEYMWLNTRFVVLRCEAKEDGYHVGGEFIEDESTTPLSPP